MIDDQSRSSDTNSMPKELNQLQKVENHDKNRQNELPNSGSSSNGQQCGPKKPAPTPLVETKLNPIPKVASTQGMLLEKSEVKLISLGRATVEQVKSVCDQNQGMVAKPSNGVVQSLNESMKVIPNHIETVSSLQITKPEPVPDNSREPKVGNEVAHSEPMNLGKNAISLSNDENGSKISQPDTKIKSDYSPTSLVSKESKARGMLEKLREIVSNPSHDFKSKFNNINFTRSAEGHLSLYSKSKFKPISTQDQLASGSNVTELNFRFRQSHIDNANAEKTRGFSPKIFPNKLASVQSTTKAKGVKRMASEPELKVNNQVSLSVHSNILFNFL